MTDSRLTDDQLEEIRRRNPCADVAAQYVRLRRGGKLGQRGPCPICSSNRQSKTDGRFECGADKWVCAVCEDGGDVIRLVRHVEQLEFLAAVERLGGSREIDQARAEQLARDRAERDAKRARDDNQYRQREIDTVRGIWGDGKPVAGSAAAGYLAVRNLELPASCSALRSLRALAYWERIGPDRINSEIHRGPAMLAAITDAAGDVQAVHMTWLDLEQPNGKAVIVHPEDREALPVKKVRGSKAGNKIELVPCADPETIVIGEGIETVLSVWLAWSLAGRPLERVAFWSSIDLGNLGGKAAGSIRHPTLKSEAGRARSVPGPVPDLEAPAIAIPASARRVIILGDGDSDPFLTGCTAYRAGARWAREDLEIVVAWAPPGQDFNDLLPDHARILAIVDAAAPPAQPASSAAEQTDVAPRQRRGRSSLPSSAEPIDPSADTAASPRLAPVAGEKIASSHAGRSGGIGGDGGAGGEPPATGGEDPNARNLRLAFFRQTDLGNFYRFVERNRGRFAYNEALPGSNANGGGWLWWSGRAWLAAGAESRIKVAEHECAKAITDEADACRDEARRLAKLHADIVEPTPTKKKKPPARDGDVIVVDFRAKVVKKRGRKKSADVEPSHDRRDADDIARQISTLFNLEISLRKWQRQSESNAKLSPIARGASAYLRVDLNKLDADPFAFNCNNGTLVFRRVWDASADPTLIGHENWQQRGEFIKFKPHDPNDYMTKVAPVDFDPDAAAPLFLQFLAEVQLAPEMRAFLQQWKGYQLTGDASEARMCIFHGRGRNGKGVFEDATGHVLGDYGSSTPVQTFLISDRARSAGQPTPDLARLPGVRSLRTSEPGKDAKLDEALVKLVTGGDPIDARHLNRPMFTFLPEFKLTMLTNHQPRIYGVDEGIWARVTLVPWSIVVPAEQRDTQLGAKLRAEASGILNWMLDGLAIWLERGLQLPDIVRQATDNYRSDSDPLGQFLATCTVQEQGAKTSSTLLHDVFVAWCKANAGPDWSPRGFAQAMQARGMISKKISSMFWLDLKLLKAVDDFVDRDGKPYPTGEATASEGGYPDAVE